MPGVLLHHQRAFLHVLFCHLPTHTPSACSKLNPALAAEKNSACNDKKIKNGSGQNALGVCLIFIVNIAEQLMSPSRVSLVGVFGGWRVDFLMSRPTTGCKTA